MTPIDELIPLTAEELKMLEAKRFSSTIGCGIFAVIIFLIAAFLAVSAFLQARSTKSSYLVFFVLAAFSILFLLIAVMMFKQRRTEDTDITRDIAEGKKRRIVAPIEGKDMIFVTSSGYTREEPPSTEPFGFSNDTTLIDLSSYDNKSDIDDKSWLLGKNLKNLAPLQKKDFLDYDKYYDYIRQNNPWMVYKKHNHGSYVHIIKVGEFLFTISSEDFLTGFKKGDFVEFSFCPHSKRYITLPEEVRA